MDMQKERGESVDITGHENQENPVEYFLVILTEKRANQSHIYCTYEYVTIHLITENAEMEEVLEPVHEVAASRRTEVSDSWN